MILEKISLINYKNIQTATLELSPKINCFIGQNGVGKTNVLDAIYYLSFCHSANNPIDSQVIRHGAEFFMIEGRYATDNGSIGLIPVVMVSPSDTLLIDGGSEERRRLMDMVISQYDRSYIEHLNRYNKALQQRNTMLKAEEEPNIDVMSLWEEQMAMAGEQIYQKRDAFVKEMVPIFQRFYETISGNREQVALNYVSHCQRGPLLEVIQRDRFKDRAVGYSLHGIHRDDLEIILGGHQMKREGSQGQHKTFVTALKLAQFDFLDQILSASSHDYKIFYVEDGNVQERG